MRGLGVAVAPNCTLGRQGLYSSVVERQSCKLKVLGSIPSGGFLGKSSMASISGLVVEYIVAIDVTRVRFPADAFSKPIAAQLGAASRFRPVLN